MNHPLVSIIMASYNGGENILESIQSVLNQSYSNWELIIVDDGSTDQTSALVKGFADSRIHYIKLETNTGVSHARNIALSKINGDYFCFLDSDDIFPKDSIAARMEIFSEDPEISFVDGRVEYVSEDLVPLKKYYQPSFRGYPFSRLARLDSRCMFGNTWMIKREEYVKYRFCEDLTHSEDLYFYITISLGRRYDFTEETILKYRVRKGSAMHDIDGLEKGYYILLNKLKDNFPNVPLNYLRLRIIRIMFLSWLFDGKNIIRAIGSFFKFLPIGIR